MSRINNNYLWVWEYEIFSRSTSGLFILSIFRKTMNPDYFIILMIQTTKLFKFGRKDNYLLVRIYYFKNYISQFPTMQIITLILYREVKESSYGVRNKVFYIHCVTQDFFLYYNTDSSKGNQILKFEFWHFLKSPLTSCKGLKFSLKTDFLTRKYALQNNNTNWEVKNFQWDSS